MTSDTPAGVHVRAARPGDLPAVLGVLDGAALETDYDRVRTSVERRDALVAVSGRDDTRDRCGEPGDDASDRSGETGVSGTVVGALVLVGDEIDAVAVRRRRRGQGIGTALVRAAARNRETLVAEFDDGVRPFYETLGFVVESLGGGRCRGRLETDGSSR